MNLKSLQQLHLDQIHRFGLNCPVMDNKKIPVRDGIVEPITVMLEGNDLDGIGFVVDINYSKMMQGYIGQEFLELLILFEFY